MDKFLQDLIARKQTEIAELQKRSEASEDLAEVRAIGSQLEALKKEIDEAQEQLRAMEAEAQAEERNEVPEQAELRNAEIISSFGGKEMENKEYRQAFMDYIMRGVSIPAELRQDANTLTTDVASVIPTELVNRIVEKMDNVGMILPEITKTSYAAGITVPTSNTKPVASWVSEGAGSDRQKKTTSQVTFTYHKLRCEISVSMEVSTMSLSAFEAKFVENVAKAMVKAIEDAVINGNGTGKPKGILAETAPSGQALTVVNGALDYAKLCEIEAAIPAEYENTAKYCMTKATFMKWVAIVDNNGQPVARVNYGIGGKPERTLLGREVIVAPYVPALTGTNKFMFAFDFNDYLLNTIYDMGISKKQDWETEDMLTKAVMSVDGKCVSIDSLVTVANTVQG